jgi:hypothetical protein
MFFALETGNLFVQWKFLIFSVEIHSTAFSLLPEPHYKSGYSDLILKPQKPLTKPALIHF